MRNRIQHSKRKSQLPVFVATVLLVIPGFLTISSQSYDIRQVVFEEPIDVGSRKQLFIDEKFIDRKEDIELKVNPPREFINISLPEPPGMAVMNYGNILEVDGEYRMYYMTIPYKTRVRSHQAYMTCLATSRDGINWVNKDANLFRIAGFKRNPVVLPGTIGTAFIDPKETDGCRFWFIGTMGRRDQGINEGINEPPIWEEAEGTWYDQGPDWSRENHSFEGGLYLLRSKDGIQWERIKDAAALPWWCDTQNQAFYDARIGKYVTYVRGWGIRKGPHVYDSTGIYDQAAGKIFNRFVGRHTASSLKDLPFEYKADPVWGRSKEAREMYKTVVMNKGTLGLYGILVPEATTPVLYGSPPDPPSTDVYQPCVNPYPWADDVYIAFPAIYRHYDGFNSLYRLKGENWTRDNRGKRGNDGPLEVQLAVSRDGIHFHRYRTPYVAPGLMSEGGSDVRMYVGLIKKGNYIYHYIAEPKSPFNTHGNHGEGEKGHRIKLAVQRMDGFVSADAGPEGGVFITPVIRFEGNRLQLNIDCGATGEAWIAITDGNGDPLKGYGMDESVSVDRNGVAQEVWWRNGPDVGGLAGKPVRLRFRLRSAKLYAFQFVNTK